jgi:hypothetical protein
VRRTRGHITMPCGRVDADCGVVQNRVPGSVPGPIIVRTPSVLGSPIGTCHGREGKLHEAGTNRRFGLLLVAVCAALAVLSYWAGGRALVVWCALAVVLLALALTAPRVLAPARRGWIRLGQIMSRLISPLVLGLVYAIVFIPLALLMRLFRRDAMARAAAPAGGSYWLRRVDPVVGADRLKDQF